MSGQGKHKNLQLVQWLRNPWGRCDNVERGPIPEWQAALMFEAANVIEHLETTRTPDPAQIRADALRGAIWAAFIAGVGQGSDEATSYEWGTAPQQSRQQAFDDFMADWNEDSAYLRAILATTLSPTAVDNSPAPDAGGKQPCNECFLPANETCDICGAVGPSGKAGGKEGV